MAQPFDSLRQRQQNPASEFAQSVGGAQVRPGPLEFAVQS